MFAALGVLVFLGALIGAGNAAIDYQLNQIDVDGNLQEVEVVGSIVAILVVLASFFVGGMAVGLGGYAGGLLGERYHKNVDAALTTEASPPDAHVS